MPTGKIISFLLGEISPALRFKTNLVSYATGLSILLNKIVRKSGGVSNRSGFQYVETPDFQDGLAIPGRVRLFCLKVAREDDADSEKEVSIVYPSEAGESPQVFGVVDGLGALVSSRDLTNVKMSQNGNTIIFSNGKEHWAVYVPTAGLGLVEKIISPKLPIVMAGVFSVNSLEVNPIPSSEVNYAVYQVFRSGEEVFYASVDGAVRPLAVGASFSHNELTIPLSSDESVKHYNLYRASSSSAGDSSGWGIVARIPKPSVDTIVKVNDYLNLPDITVAPPDEDYLYGDFGVDPKQLVSARFVGYYQQRRVVVPNSANSKLKEGSVIVSKSGAVDQLDTQILFSPIGAFDFTVPIGVTGRVLGIIELERLIVLTSDVVVIIRGGDNGVLTSSGVNPTVISYDGSSSRVTPTAAGQYGFFMSKNDDRLMRVGFTLDGNVVIDEMSLLSNHLIENDRVKELAFTRGREDIVWVLLDSGKLLSMTLHQSGEATGWARHETDGFIESISVVSKNKQRLTNTSEQDETYDALHVLVVRDGVRYLERLAFREDRESRKDQYFYCDNFSYFGTPLVLDVETNLYSNYLGFSQLNPDNGNLSDTPDVFVAKEVLVPTPYAFNIEGGVNWDEDEDITLHSLIPFSGAPGGIGQIIFSNPIANPEAALIVDFYYEEDGISKTIRWTQTGFTNGNKGTGRFNGTVPVSLRDVNAQGLPDAERREVQTRWLVCKNKIGGLKRMAGREVSILADGVVVSSPNSLLYDTFTVDVDGYIELDDYYSGGVAGLPYTSDMETLDLDTSGNRTITDSYKLINRVGIVFKETKGGYVGQTGETDLNKMERIVSREDEVLEQETKNINEHIPINIPAEWEKTGRVLVRQVVPLPMTVLSVYPKGVAGD